jgi:Rod binding domain-containing protein
MDSSKLISIEPISLTSPLGNLQKVDGIPEQKKEQISKDFESVLLGKLLDEMKNSIGDWGFEESAASEQIQGIFWLYLARHLANNGGLGMWRDIYQSLTNPEQTNKDDGVESQTQKAAIGNPDK